MSTLKAVRGTRDLLPPETALWNRIEATARAVFARYNFGEIRTPIFEDTALFARGVGEETDIVSKQMYTWSDRERFDKHALRRGWEIDYRSKQAAAWTRNVHLPHEKSDADMVFQRQDGGFTLFTLVSFVEKASKLALESLESTVNADRQRRGTDKVYGLLVYPGNTVADEFPADTRSDSAPTVARWPVQGSFHASNQSLTLRPENTAGVVRAYIEHKLGETGQLQKLYYIPPQFRRDRPPHRPYRHFSPISA